MLLSFPFMHPALFENAPVSGLRFFDPGLGDESEAMFRPEGLPVERKVLESFMRDCLSFGQQFKNSAEMAFFGTSSSEEYFSSSKVGLEAEIVRALTGAAQDKDEESEGRVKAHFTLVLAWSLEERLMELAELEQGVRQSWQQLDKTVGMDDEDRRDENLLNIDLTVSHTGGTPGIADGPYPRLPWPRILEALPMFLPQGAVLVCLDPEIRAQWEDRGVAFSPAPEESGLPAGSLMATEVAWKLAGRTSAPAGLPGALHDVSVALLPKP